MENRWPARHGAERQIHVVAARQPEVGLVRGRLLVGGRLRQLLREALSDRLRSTEFSIVANNLLDKAYLSAITENAAGEGAPRTVSMTATAPVPKPLPTASTSPRRETRA